MRIRMLRTAFLQHMGQEVPLMAGEPYDVSDVVARGLVSSGAAVYAEPVIETKQDARKGRRALVAAD